MSLFFQNSKNVKNVSSFFFLIIIIVFTTFFHVILIEEYVERAQTNTVNTRKAGYDLSRSF